MTAAVARQKTESAGTSRVAEDNRAPSPDAASPVAVLIRLPDLSEAVPEKGSTAKASIAAGRDHEPAAHLESTHRSPAPAQMSDPSPETAAPSDSDERVDNPPAEKPRDREVTPWSAVTIPRPVVQLAGVLALIGMLIGAYFAIVGGGGTVDEATGEPQGGQDVAGVAEPSPPVETKPISTAIAPALVDDQKPRDLFIETTAVETEPDAVNSEESATADGAAASAVDTVPPVTADPPSDESADLPDAELDGGSETQDDRAGTFGSDFGYQQNAQDSGDLPSFYAGPEHGQDATPETAATRELEQTVGVSPYKYPVTDPSTYQYPANYHLMFQRSPEAGNSQGTSPRPGEQSGYGWQPGTARLRPPIKPPPVRR